MALLDNEKLGLGLTAFVLIKTQQHSSEWYQAFVQLTSQMPEVLAFYRMAGEFDYLMQVEVADMKSYDGFYKRLVNGVPGPHRCHLKLCHGKNQIHHRAAGAGVKSSPDGRLNGGILLC